MACKTYVLSWEAWCGAQLSWADYGDLLKQSRVSWVTKSPSPVQKFIKAHDEVKQLKHWSGFTGAARTTMGPHMFCYTLEA